MTETSTVSPKAAPRVNAGPPERFVIVLEARASSIPAILRVRRLLKTSWRAFGLRCVSVGQPAENERL